VESVTVRFGGLVAVNDVSFDVMPGELFGLIGPNGAGKTSVLNAISGVAPVAEGRVLLGDRDITKLALHRRIRVGIARSFQGIELFPSLNVVDNLMLGRHHLMRTGVIAGGVFYGRARNEELKHRRRVEEVIDFLELYPHRAKLVGTLPFGTQKLVGVARALCAEPTILLLDEPASGLNREEREHLARFLLRIKHDLKLTTVWVEHDVRMVSDLADRVLALHYGQTVGTGTPLEVLGLDAVRLSFLGTLAEAAEATEAEQPAEARAEPERAAEKPRVKA